MRDILPPQVPQGLEEGLIRQQEEKEEKGCKPCQEELWPQGARMVVGVRPMSTSVPLFHQHPCTFSINYFVVKPVCLL